MNECLRVNFFVSFLFGHLPDSQFQIAAQLLGQPEHFDLLALFGRVGVG